jgi:hypothetical protein
MNVNRRLMLMGAQALIVVGVLIAPMSALAASFGSGLWQAKGRLTGGFHGHGVNVQIVGGGTFAFCVDVARNGGISPSASKWIQRRTVLSEHLSGGGVHVTGTGILTGTGQLGGNTSNLTVSGTTTVRITLLGHGFSMTVPSTLPFSARLPVTTATSSRVTGDIAVLSRRAQRGVGFATNERGAYIAHRVTRCTV